MQFAGVTVTWPLQKIVLFILFIFYFLKFYFIFNLYKIVLVLPNIKMNPLTVLGPRCCTGFSLVVMSRSVL